MKEQYTGSIEPTYAFDESQPWHATNHPWATKMQTMYEDMREQYPVAPEIDDPDPYVRLALTMYDTTTPPRKFWDTSEMWEQARAEHVHPITLWDRSPKAEELHDPEYITYMSTRNPRPWYWAEKGIVNEEETN